MIVRDLGRADYLPVWQAMREFTGQREAATEDELWLVEHPPVYTLGQAGRREHLLITSEIPVVATDRGGQITYHGPGQVVAYPLIDLRRLGIYVKELVYRIEQSSFVMQRLVKEMAEVDPMVDGQELPRYVGYPDNRDFFYLLRRDDPRGPR